MLKIIGQIIEYSPAARSASIKIRYTGLLKGNAEGENSMILKLSNDVYKQINANSIGKFFSFRYSVIPGNNKATNIFTVYEAQPLDRSALPNVTFTEVTFKNNVTDVQRVRDKDTDKTLGYLYKHDNKWCRMWLEDFQLSSEHLAALEECFNNPTGWMIKAKYIPKVQPCYDEYGVRSVGNCCVFRMTHLLEIENIDEDDIKNDPEVDQKFIDSIFDDEDGQEEPGNTDEYAQQYKSFMEEEEGKETPEEIKELPSNSQESQNETELPTMNTEQAFHYRLTVLDQLKTMILTEKIIENNELHKALVDHYMWLIARYEK